MSVVQVNTKSFIEAVEAIWLKGKYKSSTTSRTDVISNTCVAIVRSETLELLNGNDKSALSVTIPANSSGSEMVIFDIERLMKYVKHMKSEEINIEFRESDIKVKSLVKTVTLPRLLEHTNMNLITMIMSFKYEAMGRTAIFGKTQLNCHMSFDGKELKEAIKFCTMTGTATYTIENEGGTNFFTIQSTSSGGSDTSQVEVALLTSNGTNASVSFSAPLDKFCIDEEMTILTGNNLPVILLGNNRKMVVAPYVRSD
tara:strand:- start:848 stop:1615 length:768 start_codon:yes stop_codon:yes gene_type:complete